MDCTDRSCFPSLGGISLALVNFPDFPPPPPLPAFMAPLLIFEKDNSTESCDLCSKWGFDSLQKTGGEVNNLTFMLTMVAIISALSGAGIMAAILSIRRIRKGRSHLNPDSMRHLERKCNEHLQTLPLPPSRSTNSTPLSNTYCEGPYNDNNKEGYNIYAELHNAAPVASASQIWRRPPIPVPPMVDNCYLELRDLPGSIGCGVPCANTPLFRPQLQSQPQSPGTYSLTPSNTTTASYYTDLELKSRTRDEVQ
ncbi:uncharacterized protein LOC110858452 [Folsomia candida]|uniref:Uncharacterized protein n=1 Tax=Folsomia candida TaxID=158441 RepID=A0A226DD87_FOLCA|nr:uncharacterized protein LOC110858452 [Folsomia candida]OXA43545.1 hypothetical protein Fcan01_21592 [Folsomia candida]